MMRQVIVVWLIVVLVVAALAPAAEWENITTALLDGVPAYKEGEKWWNRRLGKVHADNVTGDVYVSLCEGWGTYRSTDCGDMWQPTDTATALGRHVGDLGVFPNPETGDFILFKVSGGSNANRSAIALERGTKWLPIRNVGDGWNAGMADWSQTPPRALLARQHHSHPKATWLSTDGGRTWEKVAEGFEYAAMLDASTIFLGREYWVLDGNRLPWNEVKKLKGPQRRKAARHVDLMLTTDRGKTMTKVAVLAPTATMPARWGDDLFWLSEDGVTVTRDRGRTWRRMGRPVREPFLGPYFGRNKNTMVVVSRDGWFRTADAGGTWTKIAEFWNPDEPGARLQIGNLRGSWDPIRDVLYIGLLGKDAYRLRLQDGADESR
jgi:hypothetical protein